jgi:cytochrome c oxidase cbb3-type subunit 4
MMDDGILRGAIAVVSLATFLGICWWAYRPASRARFEADAWLVFEEGDGVEGGPTRRSPVDPAAPARREERGASA